MERRIRGYSWSITRREREDGTRTGNVLRDAFRTTEYMNLHDENERSRLPAGIDHNIAYISALVECRSGGKYCFGAPVIA